MSTMKPYIARTLRSRIHLNQSRSLIETSSRLTNVTRNVTSVRIPERMSVPDVLALQDLNHRPSRRIPQSAPKSMSHQTQFDVLLNNITSHLVNTPYSNRNPQIPYLHSIMKAYESKAAHWARYAHANPDKQYTRNLVFGVRGVFNLLLLVWTPGKKSPVHDHADAHCLMKVLRGSLCETRYAMPNAPGQEGPLAQTSKRLFETDKVSYMADSLGLHSISNPHPTEYAVSLHLYTPPNAATRGCNVYDEHDGAARHVLQDSYDSIGGVLSD